MHADDCRWSRVNAASGAGLLRVCGRWLAGTLLGLALATAAVAASLQVSPILLEFTPQDKAQALWLTNSGDAPLRAQVRIEHWSQRDGSEHLAPTRDLVASPAVLEIAPGERQLVRIVRLQGPAAPGEQAYRLIVDELPGTQGELQAGAGLSFLLRYSIPAFTDTPASALEVADLAARWQGDFLEVQNRSHRRVRLSQLAWVNADGSRVELGAGLLGYALAGQTMRWRLPRPQTVRPGGRLLATLDTHRDEQSLPLAEPVR